MAPAAACLGHGSSTNTVCVMDASGELGLGLVQRLIQRDYTVHAVVQSHGDHHIKLNFDEISCAYKNKLKIFQSDPFDYQSIIDALRGCSGLFYTFEPPQDQPTYDECMADVDVIPNFAPFSQILNLNSQLQKDRKLESQSRRARRTTKMLRLASKRVLQGLASRSTQSPAVQVLPRHYHERVVDHYNNPRNVGSFDKSDPTVGTGLVGAPACGDVMKLQIRVDESTGKIVDACFKTFGCGSAIASSSVATEWVKGKQMEEVLTIKNTEIAKHLSLPPVKLHCSMLAEDAIKAAVKDYEAKRGAKSTASPEAAPLEKAADA